MARVGQQDQRQKKKSILPKNFKTELWYSSSVRRFVPRCIKRSVFVVVLVVGLKYMCVELWP